MHKIPTLLTRDEDDRRHVTDEVTPGCEWVLDGEGIATRKYDGTCVMLDDSGHWWARREIKPGKATPANYVATGTDEVTGKVMGWEPIDQSPFIKAHKDALEHTRVFAHNEPMGWVPSTYELIGPKVQGNPEKVDHHQLVSHEHAETFGATGTPRSVSDVRLLVKAVANTGWEGIVWHHPDGRMAKLKARDLA